MEILRSQACRDAPTLLGYVPSYKGKLKRKEKEAGKPSKKASTSKKGGGKQTGGQKKGKKPRVKFPTFRKTVEFWFRESKGTKLPGINILLQTIIPEFTKDMSRRNVVHVSLRDNVSARQSGSDQVEPIEKRLKVTHDFFPSKPPTPHPSEKGRTESSAAGGSKAILKLVGSAGHAVVQEFTPSFASARGRLVTIQDSSRSNLALQLLCLKALRCRGIWRGYRRTSNRA